MDERFTLNKTSPCRRLIFYGGPVLAYAALIYYLSSLSSFPEAVPTFIGFDKVAHFTEYFIFGCLLCRWISTMDQGRKRWPVIAMTILIGTFYALSDEWHQSFVPGRDASIWDAISDALGVGTGAVAYPLGRQEILSAKGRQTKGGLREQTSNRHD